MHRQLGVILHQGGFFFRTEADGGASGSVGERQFLQHGHDCVVAWRVGEQNDAVLHGAILDYAFFSGRCPGCCRSADQGSAMDSVSRQIGRLGGGRRSGGKAPESPHFGPDNAVDAVGAGDDVATMARAVGAIDPDAVVVCLDAFNFDADEEAILEAKFAGERPQQHIPPELEAGIA